jgi:hypothetical protein
MFWSRRATKAERASANTAAVISSTPTRSEILDALPDNLARMRQCAVWQDKARADWYLGERAEIARILNSRDLRYRNMGPAERRVIGSRMWTLNPRNKDLAGAEQMYARWVSSYSALAKADGLIP